MVCFVLIFQRGLTPYLFDIANNNGCIGEHGRIGQQVGGDRENWLKFGYTYSPSTDRQTDGRRTITFKLVLIKNKSDPYLVYEDNFINSVQLVP